jgi:hypothetical protein
LTPRGEIDPQGRSWPVVTNLTIRDKVGT